LLLERYLDAVEYGRIQQENVSFMGIINPEVLEPIRSALAELQVEVLLLALPELCGWLGDHSRSKKLHFVISQLLSFPLNYSANDLRTVFEYLTSPPGGFSPLQFRGEYISLKPFIPSIRAQMQAGSVDASLHSLFTKARQIVEDVPYPPVDITRQLREVLGEPPRIPLLCADPWAVVALADLEPTRGTERDAWIALLDHAATVSGATPSKMWMASAQTMLDEVGVHSYRNAMQRWLPRLSHSIVNDNQPAPVYEYNCDVLKGLIWFCALLNDATLSIVLADACIKCFEATPFGTIAPASGNACILVLKQLTGPEPHQQLERLKLNIKNKTALKLLDKSADPPAKPAAPSVQTVIEPTPAANVHVRPEDLEERVPRVAPVDKDEEPYSLNGGVLLWRGHYVVSGADIASFRFYLSGFAKDKKHCYHQGRRLQGGNPGTFRMLNYTWATDRNKVWCLSGPVADADGATFVACDDGHCPSQDGVPYSYGKDQYKVFHYDFDGKACWVRKADPASFETVVCGEFGRDAEFIFCRSSVLQKARRDTWQYLGQHYSKDDRRVFYDNRELVGADLDSIEVAQYRFPLARDRNRYYRNDSEITREDYEKRLAEE
jgi:hypothetical protein